ncbi:MAG: GNAT family N-acetyltransferase [Proteobacteria bacterium]|nr:GNAT family N-acetyltransferase [Pseudomonadota bacterium]
MTVHLQPPEPLTASHRLDLFECGEELLDEWLERRALGNQATGASRTFVVCEADARVRGFHSLAAGAVAHETAFGKVRRNMPDPVPVMVLGRLAVDRETQGLHLGAALRQDTMKRAVTVSENAGVGAMLVHALHEHAKRFYEHCGF